MGEQNQETFVLESGSGDHEVADDLSEIFLIGFLAESAAKNTSTIREIPEIGCNFAHAVTYDYSRC